MTLLPHQFLAIFALAALFAPPLPSSVRAGDKESEGLKTEAVSQGAGRKPGDPGNDPARCDWFEDQAIGMFVHWSVDCPLGSVISHHLVGSTKDYQDRFFGKMPQMFYPKNFEPEDW